MIGGEHLYIVQMSRTGAIKVGRSSDPNRRLGEIQTGCPYTCRLILVMEGKGWKERGIHRRLRRYRTAKHQGEWFREEALGTLPDHILDAFDPEVYEEVMSDWWREPDDSGPSPS